MTWKNQSAILRIAHTLRQGGTSEDAVEEGLRDLLNMTDSRAVGLWRVKGDELFLAGFCAKPDMPLEVAEGFAEATRNVSLTQTGLGIVKAVVTQKPAVAHIEAGNKGLADSASWLARFEAVQSLAVPIIRRGVVAGVLAMSTANPFVEEDDVWQLLTGIASNLSE